jgi:hypothetical protein
MRRPVLAAHGILANAMARIPDAFIDDRAAITLASDTACRATARQLNGRALFGRIVGP